jgi:hypothetical protein
MWCHATSPFRKTKTMRELGKFILFVISFEIIHTGRERWGMVSVGEGKPWRCPPAPNISVLLSLLLGTPKDWGVKRGDPQFS